MKTLLALLLMTGICWADEPEIINYAESNSVPRYDLEIHSLGEGTILTASGVDNSLQNWQDATYHFSCPDHYIIEGRIYNRHLSVQGAIAANTDAEIKCVKE